MSSDGLETKSKPFTGSLSEGDSDGRLRIPRKKNIECLSE